MLASNALTMTHSLRNPCDSLNLLRCCSSTVTLVVHRCGHIEPNWLATLNNQQPLTASCCLSTRV